MAHLLARAFVWRPSRSLSKVVSAQFSSKPSSWYPFLAWSSEKIMEQITNADTPIKKSVEMFEVARSKKLADTITYNAMLTKLFDGNFTNDGLTLLVQMRTDGFNPTRKTYHVVVKGLCQQGRVVEARDLLSVMTNEGISPDHTIYTALISAYLKLKDLNSVDEMIEQCTEENFGSDTYTTLIHGYLKLGLYDKSKDMLTKMTAAGLEPSHVTYNAIINGYADTGNMDRVWEIVESVREAGVALDFGAVYNSLITAFVRVRDFKRAEQLLMEMDSFCTPNITTYGCLLDGYLKIQDDKSAQRILGLMSAKGIHKDLIAYNSMLTRYCDNGMMAEASKLMEEIVIQGLMPDRIMFDCLIYGFARQRDMYSAWQSFMLMLDMRITPDAKNFATIISCFWMEGYRDMEECEKMFEMMTLQKVKPTGGVYTYMIAGFLNENNFIEASRYADMMQDAKVSQDYEVVNKVIDHFGYRKKHVLVDRFIKFAKERSLITTEIELYNSIMQQQSHRSGYVEARRVYLDIKEKSLVPTSRTFSVLLRAAKNRTECVQVFQEMTAVKFMVDEYLMKSIGQAQRLFGIEEKELPVFQM